MNVFCYPSAFRDGRVCSMLDVKPSAIPNFGFRARVPLANGKFDRTEVDMRLGLNTPEGGATIFRDW